MHNGHAERSSHEARTWSSPLSLWAAIFVVAIGLSACGGGRAHSSPTSARSPSPGPTASGAGGPVDIVNFSFSPSQATIRAGAAVVWTNRDTVAHDVYFAADQVHSKTLNKGETFSHTFDTPGTYTYICAIHPFMHGSVVVTR